MGGERKRNIEGDGEGGSEKEEKEGGERVRET
jgi:hypothetical protein